MKYIFSGEVWFALFLISGVFKESIGLSIDLTAFFLVLTACSVFFRLLKKPIINKNAILPAALFTLLTMLILLSIFYTQSYGLTWDKILKYTLLTIPSFIFPFFLLTNRKSLNRFLLTLGFSAFVASLFSLPMIFERGANIGFVGFNEGNYLGLSRITGMGLIILLFLGVFNNHFKKYRIALLVMSAVALLSMLASGARMPIIAVFIAIVFMIASSIKIKKGILSYPKFFNKIIVGLILIMIPIYWAYLKGFLNSMLFRFKVLLQQSNGGESASARTQRFKQAIEYWQDSPIIGNGFGSFGRLYTGKEMHDYPHNTFLEMLSELGLLGFLLFSLLLLVALVRILYLRKIKKVRSDNTFITVLLVFIVIFVNAMVSGDVNENRILFTFIAILCLLPSVLIKNIKSIKETVES